MTWHPSPEMLAGYRAGELQAAQVWSIEAHVGVCHECRRVVPLEESDRLEAIWQATVDKIDAPRPRLIERGLVAIGVPDHLARLLGATPSLTVPWLLAVVTVLGFGLAMAWSSAGEAAPAARAGLYPFLLLAPVVPVAGVAVAFGPLVDPAHEVAVASPFHGFRLLLIRTVTVVALSIAVALALALLLPNAGLLAAAWILPGLALAGIALAASTLVSPVVAGVGSTLAWLVSVSAIEAGPSTLATFGWAGQLVFAVILVGASAILMARRGAFEIARR